MRSRARRSPRARVVVFRRDRRSSRCPRRGASSTAGSTTRPLYSLGTTDKALARRKLARLAAAVERGDELRDAVDQTNAPERVRDYAADWLAKREAQGVGMARKERRTLEMYVLDAIGRLPLCDVRPSHVRSILDEIVAAGRKQKTVSEVRGAMNRLFRRALEAELVDVNPVAAVRVPKLREVKKEREILTDDEFTMFVASPAVDLELKMLALSSRCEGGMRTSDLHHWKWTQIAVDSFEECFIPRSKTQTPQRLVIPETLPPVLACVVGAR